MNWEISIAVDLAPHRAHFSTIQQAARHHEHSQSNLVEDMAMDVHPVADYCSSAIFASGDS